MTIGVGNLIAVICIVISIVFAIVTNQVTNALWWALCNFRRVVVGSTSALGFELNHRGLGNEGIG